MSERPEDNIRWWEGKATHQELEDAGDDYRLSSATSKEWAARALAAEAERDSLREALIFYENNARLCRLIHSEGDVGRQALSDDGGRRARAALKGE